MWDPRHLKTLEASTASYRDTFYFYLVLTGARGSLVVKALGYKPEGRGLGTR
jgi:hypothetical protein